MLFSALSLAVLTAGCVGGRGPAPPSLASVREASHEPEIFTGSVNDFYRVPAPLPNARPGTLIRIQVLGDAAGMHSVRVMYHSRDVRGRDRAVTGVISYPVGPAPAGGWPVISWAHGTTGLATQCAPSRAGAAAPGFGVQGVHVATDYIGLGPIGERHAYLSGVSEAHSVIDAVRAARQLPDAHAGTRWVAIGHSQGGHAALFTNQLARAYAPELQLLGTVAAAPAAVLGKTFGPNDQIVPRMVGIMALYGWATDYPQLRPNDYVGPQVAAHAGVIDTGCLDQIVAAFVGIPADVFYVRNPLHTPPASSVVVQNDPGRVRSRSPLLVISGTVDTFVVPARVQALFETLCARRQVTELIEVPGADHGTVLSLGARAITDWLNARLADQPAPNSCPPRR